MAAASQLNAQSKGDHGSSGEAGYITQHRHTDYLLLDGDVPLVSLQVMGAWSSFPGAGCA